MNRLGENYLEIMITSLKKKIEVLDRIIAMNEKQERALKDPNLTPDEFESVVDEKAKCIEDMELLDSGFESLYEKMRVELRENKKAHEVEIIRMQELIRKITDKTTKIQVMEKRNRDEAFKKFSQVRDQVKEIRTGHKVATEYYRNMLKLNMVDAQFMDNKR